ncbi:class I SAM-dependent methyltransferase [Nocardioides pocheonensis]|uniref:Class I SAM-dependent methyltransferase n=2 Tax=Nocardioides pocheonensis TaxID=661485 RepID=A0A3N0GNW0_9ACTN|nr:class I SAM-dependent methyltransferase [Nocardioides pocheonensis]
MPIMSTAEQVFCRSAPWRAFASGVVLPWALDGTPLRGDVLELGSGSGAMAEGMMRTHPGIRLTATDLDAAMVRAAGARLSGLPDVTVEQADVTALPFGDSAFDVVTSHLMLHHVIAWPAALAEAARVLRPGGVLVGYDFTDTRFARLIHWADRSPHRILAVDELWHGLEAVGFEDVSVRTSYRDHVMRFHARRP